MVSECGQIADVIWSINPELHGSEAPHGCRWMNINQRGERTLLHSRTQTRGSSFGGES